MIMTKLGFILKTFNRFLYIIEVLMELVENRKKIHLTVGRSWFVFYILNIFIFPISILLILPHSEKFTFIISDFPSLLFFFLIFPPFFL